MNYSNKQLLTITLVSLLSTASGLTLYHFFFQPEVVVVEKYSDAKLVAQNELLLSDRLSHSFRAAEAGNFVKAAKGSRLSVVFIEGEGKVTDDSYYTRNISKSTGSGVIISNDGYIVTNNHVIDGSDKLSVILNDKREYVAKVVGRDEQTDLALLKIEATSLPYLIFGNSDSLQVGEWVLAVGNPFRLTSSVTAGIVSAKARNINILEQKGIEAFIQTDAAVNPGNSGGALINTKGDLIGINTAILSQGGGYEGFSFAIPANLVKKIVRDLKEYGVVQRGWMGVTINNVNAALAKEIGLSEINGIYIDATTKNGAAREAGLRSGDVIVQVNDTKTNTVPQFMEQIGKFSPGDILKIEYVRRGQTLSTDVILRNQLNTTDYIAIRKDKLLTDLGFELRDLDSMEKSKFGKAGVYVVTVYKNSIIGQSNVEPGYVITSYNGIPTGKADDFISWLGSHEGAVVLEGFYENFPGEFPYTFNLEK